MRVNLLASSALLLAIAAPAFAQEDYTEFVSREDRFTITFPGKPVMTDETWLTSGATLRLMRSPTMVGVKARLTPTLL